MMTTQTESQGNRLTQAAYQALPGGPLDVDKEFYGKLAAEPRKLLEGGYSADHLNCS